MGAKNLGGRLKQTSVTPVHALAKESKQTRAPFQGTIVPLEKEWREQPAVGIVSQKRR